ncbi:hypothetical protein WJX84_006153 [Apatococcus fuscideae]|uniref:LITAF domain-containing protein n=1 Tax=Apatococcus fuscideae TaxID=2026836 RepID=A0AAW1RI98_9CHLO
MQEQTMQSGQYTEAGQVPQQVRPQPGPHTEMANPLQSVQQAPATVEGQVMSRATGYAPSPYPNIPVRKPLVPPQPGQTLLGYEIVQPETGCCKCSDLTPGGLFLLILLCICFSCLAWIPCVMVGFHRQTQRPVYG